VAVLGDVCWGGGCAHGPDHGQSLHHLIGIAILIVKKVVRVDRCIIL
jgi:hypothetical protein